MSITQEVDFVDDLIVLLGTGIVGGDGVHHVETTLFQSFIDDPDAFRITPSSQLTDPTGNGYYVPDTASLRVFQGEQHSYRQDGRTPSRGQYAVAWLDHGLAPRDASYRVAILVRGADTIGQLADSPDDYYRVVTQTDALHHVEFPTGLSGLVFFESGETDHPVIVRADEPCLVMCRQLSDDRIRIGATNPDLGLLPPDSPPPTFRSISENENQYLPSQPRSVQIVLRGNWRPLTPADNVKIVSTGNRQTIIRFDCLNGMSVQAELVRD